VGGLDSLGGVVSVDKQDGLELVVKLVGRVYLGKPDGQDGVDLLAGVESVGKRVGLVLVGKLVGQA
jgi:hypothetical protein